MTILLTQNGLIETLFLDSYACRQEANKRIIEYVHDKDDGQLKEMLQESGQKELEYHDQLQKIKSEMVQFFGSQDEMESFYLTDEARLYNADVDCVKSIISEESEFFSPCDLELFEFIRASRILFLKIRFEKWYQSCIEDELICKKSETFQAS